jgi:drug/metabolite transporter (DMT)-like permease
MARPSRGGTSATSGGGSRELSAIGLLHLSVIYLVWGSTYLAIRIAVREGSGFPPFIMAGMRVVAGGCLLFLWAAISGSRLRPTRRELVLLFAAGILLWVGGNGLVTWAEQRAHSGYAALLIGTAPLWVALLESLIDRRAPSALLVLSLLVGFSGLAALTFPVLRTGTAADIYAVLALLGAPLSWGIGSILQQRRRIMLSTSVTSAYHQLFGGLGFAVAALLSGEPRPAPVADAWWAWGYLVIFGSVFAFTSFVRALRLLPINVVMTYAYVNPVIAVILGRIILDEPITLWTVVGMVLVLLGVAGVFRERYA